MHTQSHSLKPEVLHVRILAAVDHQQWPMAFVLSVGVYLFLVVPCVLYVHAHIMAGATKECAEVSSGRLGRALCFICTRTHYGGATKECAEVSSVCEIFYRHNFFVAASWWGVCMLWQDLCYWSDCLWSHYGDECECLVLLWALSINILFGVLFIRFSVVREFQ